MKRFFLLLLMVQIIFPSTIFSQTNISTGPVSGTWTKAASPYLIQGDILVEEGASMIIEPGTIIEFMGHYSFRIEGNLKASGTPEEMIQFTKTDTIGLSKKDPDNGGWNGLLFETAQDTNIVNYCVIEYCNTYYDTSTYWGKSPVNGFKSLLNVSNSIIRNNYSKDGALKIVEGEYKILNNLFDYNKAFYGGGAIYSIKNGSKLIEGNIITNNWGWMGGGVFLTEAGLSVILKNNFISQNYSVAGGGGITAYNDASPQIIQNIIVNNEGGYGGAIYFSYSGMILLNNTICNNYSFSSAAIQFRETTLMNGQNNILWGNRNNSSIANIGTNSTSFPEFNYNLIEDGVTSFIGSPENVSSLNMTEGDPQFENPTTGVGISYASVPSDWKLLSSSPCLNIGSTNDFPDKIPEYDFSGQSRISYEYIDLGSMEFNIPVKDVTDDISIPTEWIADTIKIWNDISVNASLTIAPDVVVEFQGYFSINFNDTLFAVGTEINPIKFMSYDTTNLMNEYSSEGTYNSIQFNSAHGSIMKYCEIRHAADIEFIDSDNIIFENNLIEDCKANRNTCQFHGNNISVFNNVFRKNMSKLGGGLAVIGTTSENIIIKGNKIYNNKLSGMENRGNNLKFINNLVYNNYWIALSIRSGYNLVFLNNTIAYNRAPMYIGTGTYYIANNIFCENGYADIVALEFIDEVKLYNNLFASERVAESWEISKDNIFADPLFKNPYPIQGQADEVMTADYSLMNISPAINMGFNDAPDIDLIDMTTFGIPRINNLIIDIGALENQGSSPVISIQPNGGIFCENESVTITVIPVTSDTLLYQWKKNGEIIPGENMESLNIESVTIEDAGNYTCILSNSYGKIESFPALISIKSMPVILNESDSESICEKQDLVLEISASGDLPFIFSWKKDGIDLITQTKTKLKIVEINLDDSGLYRAYVSNSCGTDSSSEMDVKVNPLPSVSLGNDSSFCANSNFILDPGIYHSYLWNDFTSDRYKEVKVTSEYFVRLTDNNFCEAYSDTVFMQVSEPYSNSQICMVTVDSSTQKNMIIWERTPNAGIQSYNIYKLFGTSYVPIGNVLYDSEYSYLIDYQSNPEALAARYSITVIDTCGNESDFSPYHQTIHLGASLGVEPNTYILDWSSYEDESGIWEPEFYYCLAGSSPDKMEEIFSISSSFTEWNDTDPGDRVYYQIEIRKANACFVTLPDEKKADSGPFIHSFSNLEDNRIKTGILDINSIEISPFPNPMENWSIIDIPLNKKFPVNVKITDINGRLIRMTEYYDNHIIIERGELKAGFYFIEIVSDKKYTGKLMVK